MKRPPPTMKTPTPAAPDTITRAVEDAMAPQGIRWRPAVLGENLPPYEAAAKAIFVKANGLAAYYRTTGIARYAR
jgi:hypothetical protein